MGAPKAYCKRHGWCGHQTERCPSTRPSKLAAAIAFWWSQEQETPEERWKRMRKWVEAQIVP